MTKGFVYIVTYSGMDRFKIGMTKNLEQRMDNYRTSYGDDIEYFSVQTDNMEQLEKQIHQECSSQRLFQNRELFKKDKDHDINFYKEKLQKLSDNILNLATREFLSSLMNGKKFDEAWIKQDTGDNYEFISKIYGAKLSIPKSMNIQPSSSSNNDNNNLMKHVVDFLKYCSNSRNEFRDVYQLRCKEGDIHVYNCYLLDIRTQNKMWNEYLQYCGNNKIFKNGKDLKEFIYANIINKSLEVDFQKIGLIENDCDLRRDRYIKCKNFEFSIEQRFSKELSSIITDTCIIQELLDILTKIYDENQRNVHLCIAYLNKCKEYDVPLKLIQKYIHFDTRMIDFIQNKCTILDSKIESRDAVKHLVTKYYHIKDDDVEDQISYILNDTHYLEIKDKTMDDLFYLLENKYKRSKNIDNTLIVSYIENLNIDDDNLKTIIKRYTDFGERKECGKYYPYAKFEVLDLLLICKNITLEQKQMINDQKQFLLDYRNKW